MRPPWKAIGATLLAGWVATVPAGPAAAQAAPPPADAQAPAPPAGQPAPAPGAAPGTATGTSPAPAPARPAPSGPAAVRVRDLVRVEGLHANQLVGLGLVVGLDGTGDGRSGSAHLQMIANMLEHFGVSVDAHSLRPRNVAAVVVTATLPALARPGDRLDVTVSSLGDARSLAGGVLLQTPLQGADGEVYAVAQGSLVVGLPAQVRGGGARPAATVATVPGGAIVERAVEAELLQDGTLRLVLNRPDFSMAARVVDAINRALGEPAAFSQDGAVVTVRPPRAFQGNPVGLLAAIEDLTVVPVSPGRVVISERTGTVVIGNEVRIAPVAVAHGGLRVRVGEPAEGAGAAPTELQGSTGLPATGGLPAGSPAAPGPSGALWPPLAPAAGPQQGHVAVLQATASVGELVDALNALGATPRDIVTILQAIQAAGALYGQLEVL